MKKLAVPKSEKPATVPEIIKESTDPNGTQIEAQILVRVGRAAMAIQIRIGMSEKGKATINTPEVKVREYPNAA